MHEAHAEKKLGLEIDLLLRQLNEFRFRRRVASAFLSAWIPSTIAAVVLFTLVPFANFLAWKNQKSIEVHNIALGRRMEIFSDFTSNSTRVSQLIVYLNDAYEIKKGRPSQIGFDVRAADLEPRIAKLQDERRETEPKFVKSLRDVELYFSSDAVQEVEGIRSLYNRVKEPPGSDFVADFLARRDKLAALMAAAIRTELAAQP